jgi:hypothetical protein
VFIKLLQLLRFPHARYRPKNPDTPSPACRNPLSLQGLKNYSPMSLLNQNNKKGKKKDNKKAPPGPNQGSKFIQKPKSTGFVSKQSNTGSQRGS